MISNTCSVEELVLQSCLENVQQKIENAGAIDQADDQCKQFRGLGGDIVQEIEKIPEARRFYEDIRKRTVPLMYIGISDISSKSEVRRDHIPILIKAGVSICMGVMKSENNSGFIEKFKRLIINAEIVLREISSRNKQLGKHKFSAFQLFGHFLKELRDELVEIILDCNFARKLREELNPKTQMTFATGVKLVIVFIAFCYVIQRTQ